MSIASSLGEAGRPASLGATRYELIIILKTVNARDLDVPATPFVRVDEWSNEDADCCGA
jgi:hypothetical protein